MHIDGVITLLTLASRERRRIENEHVSEANAAAFAFDRAEVRLIDFEEAEAKRCAPFSLVLDERQPFDERVDVGLGRSLIANLPPPRLESRKLFDLEWLAIDRPSDRHELLTRLGFAKLQLRRIVNDPVPLRESPRRSELAVAELGEPALDPKPDMFPRCDTDPVLHLGHGSFRCLTPGALPPEANAS